MYKHYITIDENNNIIDAFSDAFKKPIESDICINENGQRQFFLSVKDRNGKYNYKYENEKIIEITDEEKINLDEEKDKKIKEIKGSLFNQLLEKTYDELKITFDSKKTEINNATKIADLDNITI